MLKKNESEETIVFFVTFLSLVAFQLRGGGPGALAPLAMPMSPGEWPQNISGDKIAFATQQLYKKIRFRGFVV